MSSYPGIPIGWVLFGPDKPHPEPLQIIAGDSLNWVRGFEDYSASAGWTLQYVLNSPTQKYVIAPGDVTADGEAFQVAIPESETKTWQPGDYMWLAVLTNGTQRITGAIGRVTIMADVLDATTPIDTREPEEIALANIETMLAGRAGDGVQSYKINDRELKRYSMAELLTLKAYYSEKVKGIRKRRGEYVPPDTIAVHFELD